MTITIKVKPRDPEARGFIDTILHLIEKGLHWVADMLETADAYLANKLGPQWWKNTELQKFAPKTT